MNNEMTTDNMSNEEVIEVLKGLVFGSFDRTTRKERQALDLAIKALQERPQGKWYNYVEDSLLKARHGKHVLYDVDFLLDHLAHEVSIMEQVRQMRDKEI